MIVQFIPFQSTSEDVLLLLQTRAPACLGGWSGSGLEVQLAHLLSQLVRGLHGGEEQHLLDVPLVGQEHGHAIYAHAPASSGR